MPEQWKPPLLMDTFLEINITILFSAANDANSFKGTVMFSRLFSAVGGGFAAVQ